MPLLSDKILKYTVDTLYYYFLYALNLHTGGPDGTRIVRARSIEEVVPLVGKQRRVTISFHDGLQP
jgi:hypothetical protein